MNSVCTPHFRQKPGNPSGVSQRTQSSPCLPQLSQIPLFSVALFPVSEKLIFMYFAERASYLKHWDKPGPYCPLFLFQPFLSLSPPPSFPYCCGYSPSLCLSPPPLNGLRMFGFTHYILLSACPSSWHTIRTRYAFFETLNIICGNEESNIQ